MASDEMASASDDLAAAAAEAEELLDGRVSEGLSAEELAAYMESGFVIVRGLLPERVAEAIRAHVIHRGLLLDGLDVCDPTTWGKGGRAREQLTVWERLVTLLGSESCYYGARHKFGRALREGGGDASVPAVDLATVQRLWAAANAIADRRLRVVMDQLAGLSALRPWRAESVLGEGVHVRYALPAKDPGCSAEAFRWPCFGWHVDGAWHRHLLGKRVETGGERREKTAHAAVGMLAWNKTLPHGGMTGVICGSHRHIMQLLKRTSRCGGVSNLSILVCQSIFGGAASDPIERALGEKVMSAGDLLLMHPYLLHSSSWNYQQALRLGGHIQFDYHTAMDEQELLDLCRRQRQEADGRPLPANSQLFAEVLE